MAKAKAKLNTASQYSPSNPIFALLQQIEHRAAELEDVYALMEHMPKKMTPAWHVLDKGSASLQDDQIDCWAALARCEATTPVDLLAKARAFRGVVQDWLAGIEIFTGTEELVLSWVRDVIRIKPQHRKEAALVLRMVLAQSD